MTSLMDEYFECTKTHINDYGGKCIVLMLVGSFYEMYGIREKGDKDGAIKQSEIEDVCRVCELAVKQRTYDYNNCDLFMAGFRDYSLDKYLIKITNDDYRCFVYDQFTEDTKIVRKLANIYSPGTLFGVNTVNKNLSNNVSCIWVEMLSSKLNDSQIIWGFSTINTNTGSSNIFEFKSLNNEMGISEIERYLSVYSPSEIIVICVDSEEKELTQYLNIIRSSTNILNIIHTNNKSFSEIIGNCEKQIYMKESFIRYFEINDYSSFIEHYSYYQIASQSFCFLLDWVYKHNVYLTTRLDEPKLEIHSKNVYLGCHSLKQLNIIAENKNESVIDLLNICKTSMGKRLLKEQMVQPVYDNEYLNNEYNITDNLIKSYDTITNPTRQILQKFFDNQQLLRTLIMRKTTPRQVYNIYSNILNCNNILNIVENNNDIVKYLSDKKLSVPHIMEMNDQMKKKIDKIFQIDKLYEIENITITDNIFSPDYSHELNELEKEMLDNKNELNNIVSELNKIIMLKEKKNYEYVKLSETEKAIPHIICTQKRSEIIKTYISSGRNPLYIKDEVLSSLSIQKNTASNVYITNGYIHTVSSKYMKFREVWREKLLKVYMESIEDIIKMFDDLKDMGIVISLIDVITCKAEIALRFNYCRPIIDEDRDDCKSYVNAREIRHSLIERLDNDDTYITNDLSLGKEEQGILLYGTNAVGKTSLIKALGICIILAQSGFYVPCSEFIYYPYTQIFTRILSNDNMFKGLSTFATEMVEMRTILNMSNDRTCVLGDELCSGTEHDSAVSIFVAGLQWLYDKRCSFIFATHLHEITKLEEINTMTKLSLKHLTVKYDKEQDILIYDRKLKDGMGDTLYGLEVCKSLHLPDQFIENAYTIRNNYKSVKSILDSKTSSRYNSKVIINKCSICNLNDASEVHHIKEQRDANDNGFIQNVHKNHISNLLQLCEKCHNNVHKNNVKLEKRKTSKGVQVMSV